MVRIYKLRWQRPWWSEYINLGGFHIDLMWLGGREYNMARSHRGCVWIEVNIFNLGGFHIDLMWLGSLDYNMARSHRECAWIEVNIFNLGGFYIDLNVAG
jgi:hypothetical protein